jgi:hypothetical protein
VIPDPAFVLYWKFALGIFVQRRRTEGRGQESGFAANI